MSSVSERKGVLYCLTLFPATISHHHVPIEAESWEMPELSPCERKRRFEVVDI